MLFLLFLVIAFFYAWNNLYLPDEEEQIASVAEEEETIDRSGEQIEYDVYLGALRIGTAKYHHLRQTVLKNRKVELITFFTEAVKFKDRETIYCDSETFLPLLVERKISKPITPEKIREEYDQENFKLTITKKRFFTSVKEIKSDAPIHNSILLPFFVRAAPDLEVGWNFTANLPQGKYLIKLTKIDKVTIPAGEFEAYYFESDPDKFKIWIGTDENRIPLRIDGSGGIGYNMQMKNYNFPGRKNEK